MSLLHSLLFVSGQALSDTEVVFSNNISFPTQQTDFINLTIELDTDSKSYVFPIRLYEEYPIGDDNTVLTTKYLTQIDFFLFRNESYASLGYGQSFFQEMPAKPSTYQLLVRDMSTAKESYTFPSIEQWGYASS